MLSRLINETTLRRGAGFFVTAIMIAGLSACTGNKKAIPVDTSIVPSEGFLARKQAYLDHCAAGNGPGAGGIHGQVCVAKTGGSGYHVEEIEATIEKINARLDTSDFNFNSMIRVLYFDSQNPTLPDDLRARMKKAVLDFKYWLDETGPDTMCWWSENHQVLFHTAELLAGLLYPDEVFSNSGMTGAEHADHARPLLRRWFGFRGKFGFSEWHSNVYFNEDIPPLVNLVDFADAQDIRDLAAMTLDMIYFDMLTNYYKGYFATTHGRTYPGRLMGGLNDSIREVAYLFGLTSVENATELGAGSFGGGFIATSDNYFPPAILEEVALDSLDNFVNRQRDSINVDDGPDYGIGYEKWEDIMFWWGMTGYVAPQIIMGTLKMVDHFDMWNGFTWEDLQVLKPLVGNDLVREYSELAEPMSLGVALETVNTYTYRTPYYQLSGAQDFKPSSWTAQVHIWQATIDRTAYVFTTYPGGVDGDYMGGEWTGGFVPRATFEQNVGVLQYWRPEMSDIEDILSAAAEVGYGFDFVDYSHAYFPKDEFDPVLQQGNWTFGKKGDSYIGLWSQMPATWTTENNYELIADARENIWIVELGDVEANGSFESFTAGLADADIVIDDKVNYNSPSLGQVVVGREGPMTVAGAEVATTPHDRWDNKYAQQKFGTSRTEIGHNGRKLILDFENATRRMQ